MRRSTGATEPVFQGACRVTRPAGRARAQYGENRPASNGSRLDLELRRADAAQSELSVEPARSSPSHGARPGVKHRHRPEGCASAWPACPRRSTWNMAPDSAGVRSPLNARAHGHGRANPSDDPGSGPSGRGPSEQTPAPGHHPRAGLAGDASGLRFYPATSRPVERAVLAPRVADGIRPLVTPRLTLWQVLPVHGAAGEEALPAVDIRVRVPRGTSRSGGGRRRRSWAAWRRLPVRCVCRHGSRREQLGSGTPVAAARRPMGRRRALCAGVSSAGRRRWMARRPRRRLLRRDFAPVPLTLSERGPIVPYKRQ